MKQDGLILYLPFDDPDGGGKAYDYSSSRADAVLSGDACFSRYKKMERECFVLGR